MEQLEALYESPPSLNGFVDRKYEIPSYTLNIHGPPRSGKSWLVIDFLSRLPRKKYLYVDLRDLRIDKKALVLHLERFIAKKGIETLVLDHFDANFDPPECQQLVTVTRAPWRPNPLMPLLEISSLDFEEYLAFERRHVNLEHSFSLYLRTGALPEMAQESDTTLTIRHHAVTRSLFPDSTDLTIWRHLCRYQGKPFTPHQLYTQLKKAYKISKDRLYATLKRWETEGLFTGVPKLGQKRGSRRLLFFDFALPASLYFEKSLMGQLRTLAARHRLKRHLDCAYTDTIDLVDLQAKEAIFISPFATAQSSAAKIARTIEKLEKLGMEKITILTISNAFAFTFDTLPITGRPIYEWLLED